MHRYTAIFIILFVFATQLAFAQRRPQPRQGPKKLTVEQRLEKLNVALNLTPEQKKAIRKILEDSDARIKKIFEQNKGDRRAMRAAMADQRKITSQEIMNLLSNAQKEKYKEYLKQTPPRQRPHKRFNHSRRRGRGNF